MKEHVQIILDKAKELNVQFEKDTSEYNADQLLILFAARLKGLTDFYPCVDKSDEEMNDELVDILVEKGLSFTQSERDLIYSVSPYCKVLEEIIQGLKGFSQKTSELKVLVKEVE